MGCFSFACPRSPARYVAYPMAPEKSRAFPRLLFGSLPTNSSVGETAGSNGDGDGLTQLAGNADLFIVHNAVPEGATGVERRLHMPPSVIGTIAANANVKKLVLSHRMLRTLGKEEQTKAEIQPR